MKEINNFTNYEDVVSVLQKDGAFLTVKDRDGNLNAMTIGWALSGIIWRRPVMMVAVRPVRHTYTLLENADDFTVTFPFSDMKEELVCCGSKSGRDLDKFKECSLVTVSSKKINSPIVSAERGRFYECKIVQKTLMDKNNLDPDCEKNFYQSKGHGSHHVYYFGEIMACYEA